MGSAVSFGAPFTINLVVDREGWLKWSKHFKGTWGGGLSESRDEREREREIGLIRTIAKDGLMDQSSAGENNTIPCYGTSQSKMNMLLTRSVTVICKEIQKGRKHRSESNVGNVRYNRWLAACLDKTRDNEWIVPDDCVRQN